jgi:hypothetical protein
VLAGHGDHRRRGHPAGEPATARLPNRATIPEPSRPLRTTRTRLSICGRCDTLGFVRRPSSVPTCSRPAAPHTAGSAGSSALPPSTTHARYLADLHPPAETLSRSTPTGCRSNTGWAAPSRIVGVLRNPQTTKQFPNFAPTRLARRLTGRGTIGTLGLPAVSGRRRGAGQRSGGQRRWRRQDREPPPGRVVMGLMPATRRQWPGSRPHGLAAMARTAARRTGPVPGPGPPARPRAPRRQSRRCRQGRLWRRVPLCTPARYEADGSHRCDRRVALIRLDRLVHRCSTLAARGRTYRLVGPNGDWPPGEG